MRSRAAITTSRLNRRELLAALRALRKGDFSVRLPAGPAGVDGEISEAFNDIALFSERITGEFEQLAQMVGKLGRIRHRAHLPDTTGSWAASIDAVNGLIGDL